MSVMSPFTEVVLRVVTSSSDKIILISSVVSFFQAILLYLSNIYNYVLCIAISYWQVSLHTSYQGIWGWIVHRKVCEVLSILLVVEYDLVVVSISVEPVLFIVIWFDSRMECIAIVFSWWQVVVLACWRRAISIEVHSSAVLTKILVMPSVRSIWSWKN